MYEFRGKCPSVGTKIQLWREGYDSVNHLLDFFGGDTTVVFCEYAGGNCQIESVDGLGKTTVVWTERLYWDYALI